MEMEIDQDTGGDNGFYPSNSNYYQQPPVVSPMPLTEQQQQIQYCYNLPNQWFITPTHHPLYAYQFVPGQPAYHHYYMNANANIAFAPPLPQFAFPFQSTTQSITEGDQ